MLVKKFSIPLLAALILSACTQMERFSTDKILPDAQGSNTANLKLTTSVDQVFIIPNATCISLSDSVVALNNQYPKRTTEGWTLWNGWSKVPFEENKGKTIGMHSLSLDDLAKKYNFYNKTYISNEYKLEAGQPYVIFMKKSGEHIHLLVDSAENEFAFGLVFTPEKNKNYQLIADKTSQTFTTWTSATTANNSITDHFLFYLLDIDSNPPELIKIQRAYGCKK
ncbi:hypothetical protein [Avibacterium paragallinarum]|uniref:Uncharacterized protein n=1 Tax=Avibacterium paragallinarum TaxID=728 RepID=A0A0F5EXM8_AVIPA|nr:hypothetical protein [Avibacterium paragallinarum]KAA6208889.1 hypothetical protein F1968_06900 [Avibacterium paragallinarum]KKB01286.1 hypothetical protein Z012_07305 [Avibacterium paragallinarum]RZN71013.1 hypothetical protein EIG77_07905 [Avibacterium paragallinarum]SUV40619.1 Uncharacterised protein [Avibacterium paragallinarum]